MNSEAPTELTQEEKPITVYTSSLYGLVGMSLLKPTCSPLQAKEREEKYKKTLGL